MTTVEQGVCRNCSEPIARDGLDRTWHHTSRHGVPRREQGSHWCSPHARITSVPIVEPAAEPVETNEPVR